ncbi:MAG: hypothetical protein ACUZ8E_11600 [Candidatus Anammoxibacter sp.]
MFSQYKTVSETKQAYKKLAFLLHPDRKNGSHEAFVSMQALYLAKLKSLHGQTSTGFDKKEHTYYYNQAVESEVMEKITELLNLKANDIDIELCGVWLWVSGNTRAYKEKLKKLALRWHSSRGKWYFHTKTNRKRKMSKMSMDQIRYAYGSRSFEAEKQEERRAIA